MNKKLVYILPVIFINVLFFQNCGSGNFESINQISSSLNSEGTGGSEAPFPAEASNDIQTQFSFVNKPEVMMVSETEATIDWTLTENSQGSIEYGKNQQLNSKNPPELSFRFDRHIQSIKNLEPNTVYYYRTLSTNENGDVLYSEINSFKTAAADREPAQDTTENTPPEPTPVQPQQPEVMPPAPAPTPVAGYGAKRPLARTPSSPINPNAFYVAKNGNDSNDGRSVNNPLKTINAGIKKLSPGYTLYVKAGDYSNERINTTLKGTANSLITIEGYRNTPGDNPTITNFNHHSNLNPSIMPYIDGKTRRGTGAMLRGSYFVFKNFQLTNFQNGVMALSINNATVENIIVTNLGRAKEYYNGHGIVFTGARNSNLRNSVVVNAVAEAISFRNSTGNIAEGNSVYCNDDSVKQHFIEGKPIHATSATDYYFILTKSYKNIIRNNYIERVGNLAHQGHGFSVKSDNEDNLFEYNTAVNLLNGGFVVRWRGTKNNLFRKNHAIGANCILTRDGASNNRFEDSLLENCTTALAFMDTLEDRRKQSAGYNNLYKNLQIKNVDQVIHFHWYSYTDALTYDNTFDNLNVDGANSLILGQHNSKNNVIRNSTFSNVDRYLELKSNKKASDIDVRFVNSRCTNCSFQLPN